MLETRPEKLLAEGTARLDSGKNMDRSRQNCESTSSSILRDTRDPNADKLLFPAFLICDDAAVIFVGLDWDENLKLKSLLAERGYRVSLRLREIPKETEIRSPGLYLN